jgi:uncharacterized protein
MAKDDKPKDLIGYDSLQQDALRGVVRGALDRAATPRGLPGDHHFYLSFRTDFPGVAIPEELVTRYPEEMTIVLQNQFWDLSPGETSFSVTLQFSGQPKSMTIPYAAMTRFYDPSVQYLLQFTPGAPPRRAVAPQSAPPVEAEDGLKVVSLDQFRKK